MSKRKPSVLVTSPGGMGCTYVLDCISKLLPTNLPNDGDGLKHCLCPAPGGLLPDVLKVVYVWNDPLRAILSHHRRGWLAYQCYKLGGMSDAALGLDSLWDATIRYREDVFGIRRHALSWLHSCDLPLFVLDLRDIESNRERLGHFLGTPPPDIVSHQHLRPDPISVPAEVSDLYTALDDEITRAFSKKCIVRKGGAA